MQKEEQHSPAPIATISELERDLISIDFDLPSVPVNPSEPEDYAHLIKGKILYLTDEESKTELGDLSAMLIQVNRATEGGWGIYDILDAPTSETAEILQLFGPIERNTLTVDGAEFNEAVQRLFRSEVWVGDILLIEKMEIKPEYRGHDVGLIAARTLIEIFGAGCSLVVCKPFPLQYFNNVNDENRAAFRLALRLQKYWGRAGFKRVPKTELAASTFGICDRIGDEANSGKKGGAIRAHRADYGANRRGKRRDLAQQSNIRSGTGPAQTAAKRNAVCRADAG